MPTPPPVIPSPDGLDSIYAVRAIRVKGSIKDIPIRSNIELNVLRMSSNVLPTAVQMLGEMALSYRSVSNVNLSDPILY